MCIVNEPNTANIEEMLLVEVSLTTNIISSFGGLD